MSIEKDIAKTIIDNPDLEIKILCDSDSISDYGITMQVPYKVEVRNVLVLDEYFYLDDEYDTLLEQIAESIEIEKYGYGARVSTEHTIECYELAEEEVKKYTWTPMIIVWTK